MSETATLHAQTRTPISSLDSMAHHHPHYRSPFGDTTFTKLFVGGLAWETPTEEMRKYFEQFGDILEAVIITDKNTGKSKGYGFVCSHYYLPSIRQLNIYLFIYFILVVEYE